MSTVPSGEERQVKFLGGAAIDGAAVSYIIAFAAVVAVLSFIPFSVVLATGGSFPISQGIWPLVGWILGPIAGTVANGVGTLIGIFVAPQTAGVPFITMLSALSGSFAAGCMVLGAKRNKWWIPVAIVSVVLYLLYIGRALFVNGVSLYAAIAGSIGDWSGILLFILPTRILFAKWVNSKNIGLLSLGLFLGTWMICGIYQTVQDTIGYWMYNWPEEVWIMLIPIIPVETAFRCLVAVVIGNGVIGGLRAIGLVKPEHAIY